MLAAGSDYLRFIPGSDLPFVLTAKEALLHPEKVGESVVIIGGGISGAETAEYFSDEPRKITFQRRDGLLNGKLLYTSEPRVGAKPRKIDIVEMRSDVALDMYEDNAEIMRIRLKEYGVTVHGSTAVERITPDGIGLRSTLTGERYMLRADTIILSAGLKPHEVAFSSSGILVYPVGDSSRPGNIIDALYSGLALGRML